MSGRSPSNCYRKSRLPHTRPFPSSAEGSGNPTLSPASGSRRFPGDDAPLSPAASPDPNVPGKRPRTWRAPPAQPHAHRARPGLTYHLRPRNPCPRRSARKSAGCFLCSSADGNDSPYGRGQGLDSSHDRSPAPSQTSRSFSPSTALTFISPTAMGGSDQ